MAAVTPKAHGNAGTPGTSTWTVTPTGSPVSGDLMAISVATDSTTNLVSSVSNLGAGALVFSTTVGTGSATLILGVYNGSAPVLTLSSAWGVNHGKLGWALLDQTVYASWGTPGTVFNRSGSQTTTTAPSTGSSAAPNMAFWWDKTTSQSSCSTGITDIENVLPTTGFAGSLCISTYDDAGGVATQTATYGIASANGKGIQVPVVLAAASFNGSASFTGSGALTATGAPSFSDTAAFAGTGTLTALAGGSFSGTAAFTGAGVLTAAGAPAIGGTASLTGAGTLTASGRPNVAGSAAFTGTGVLTAHAAGPVDTFINPANWPMYVAHRGGSADWVEETMFAYGQSVAWNPTGLALEISVWQTSDGVWVCSHDQSTARMFGTNLDIPTNTWATLSTLRTTTGSYPLARLSDVLTAYANGTRVFFIDNKGQTNSANLLTLLDTYGGSSNFIAKGFITATTWADAATAHGLYTWGYGYDADVQNGNMANLQSHWSLLGMDALAATSQDWVTTKAFGKPVLAHIIATAAQKTTAVGFGANGFMASGVQEVIPQTPAPASFTGTGALTGSGKPSIGGTASFTGVGILTAIGAANATALANFASTGTLTAIGVPRFAGTASFTGTGVFSAVQANPVRDLTLTAIPGRERWASIPSPERWAAIPARERWSAIPEVS